MAMITFNFTIIKCHKASFFVSCTSTGPVDEHYKVPQGMSAIAPVNL